jgi:hypothetical protein
LAPVCGAFGPEAHARARDRAVAGGTGGR